MELHGERRILGRRGREDGRDRIGPELGLGVVAVLASALDGKDLDALGVLVVLVLVVAARFARVVVALLGAAVLLVAVAVGVGVSGAIGRLVAAFAVAFGLVLVIIAFRARRRRRRGSADVAFALGGAVESALERPALVLVVRRRRRLELPGVQRQFAQRRRQVLPSAGAGAARRGPGPDPDPGGQSALTEVRQPRGKDLDLLVRPRPRSPDRRLVEGTRSRLLRRRRRHGVEVQGKVRLVGPLRHSREKAQDGRRGGAVVVFVDAEVVGALHYFGCVRFLGFGSPHTHRAESVCVFVRLPTTHSSFKASPSTETQSNLIVIGFCHTIHTEGGECTGEKLPRAANQTRAACTQTQPTFVVLGLEIDRVEIAHKREFGVL
mmetsp:Transcript_21409/g.39998  ORF Transcript_21409/g.39998 Transcript_21409/m.39998 type:complete len:379 (-) Transcript_21409:9-1145(-)